MPSEIHIGCLTTGGDGEPISYAVLTLTVDRAMKLCEWMSAAAKFPPEELCYIEFWAPEFVRYYRSSPSSHVDAEDISAWRRLTSEDLAELEDELFEEVEGETARVDGGEIWFSTLVTHDEGVTFETLSLNGQKLDEFSKAFG